MRFIFPMLALLIYSSASFAFINIESVRAQPGDGFLGKSSVKVAGQRGNTNKFTTNLSSVAIERGQRDEFLVLGSYAYSYTSDVRDTNNASLHFRYTFFDREENALETFVQYEFDEFKDLNDRNLGGANLRHRFYKDQTSFFFGGAGGFFELEDYKIVGTRRGFRGNFYVSYVEKLSDRATATGVIYYQPLIDSLDDFRIRFQAGLEMALSTKFSVDIDLTVNHDNWVPGPVQKTDTMYTVGFSYTY